MKHPYINVIPVCEIGQTCQSDTTASPVDSDRMLHRYAVPTKAADSRGGGGGVGHVVQD